MNLTVNVGDLFIDGDLNRVKITDENVEQNAVRVETEDDSYWTNRNLIQNWLENGVWDRRVAK